MELSIHDKTKSYKILRRYFKLFIFYLHYSQKSSGYLFHHYYWNFSNFLESHIIIEYCTQYKDL